MRWESSRLRGGVEVMLLGTVAGKGGSLGHDLVCYLHE